VARPVSSRSPEAGGQEISFFTKPKEKRLKKAFPLYSFRVQCDPTAGHPQYWERENFLMQKNTFFMLLTLSLFGLLLFGTSETARGADPVSQLAMPAGKLLFDHAFAELEVSMDIPHPREVVLPRVHVSMVSRDFVHLPERSSENLLVFAKWEGLFRTTQYLVAFEVVDYDEGTRLGVTLSEPIQLFFIDPGILGRKPRSVRYLKPVLEEIGTIPE